MERPSCVGCLLTSGVLAVVFTTLISMLLNRIFKAGAFDEVSSVSMYGVTNLFMAHKTLIATSFIAAMFPTFYVAALINDIYVKFKRKREKEIEEATEAYHKQKDQRAYNQTLPKAEVNDLDPTSFKAPTKSLPKSREKDEEPEDKP